jgi:hypothetical protein
MDNLSVWLGDFWVLGLASQRMKSRSSLIRRALGTGRTLDSNDALYSLAPSGPAGPCGPGSPFYFFNASGRTSASGTVSSARPASSEITKASGTLA